MLLWHVSSAILAEEFLPTSFILCMYEAINCILRRPRSFVLWTLFCEPSQRQDRFCDSSPLRRCGEKDQVLTVTAGKPPSGPEFGMVKHLSDGTEMATAAVVMSITEASPTKSTHDVVQEPPRAHLVNANSQGYIIQDPINPIAFRQSRRTPAQADSLPILQTSSPIIRA